MINMLPNLGVKSEYAYVAGIGFVGRVTEDNPGRHIAAQRGSSLMS